jgi:hypothetical protein
VARVASGALFPHRHDAWKKEVVDVVDVVGKSMSVVLFWVFSRLPG